MRHLRILLIAICLLFVADIPNRVAKADFLDDVTQPIDVQIICIWPFADDALVNPDSDDDAGSTILAIEPTDIGYQSEMFDGGNLTVNYEWDVHYPIHVRSTASGSWSDLNIWDIYAGDLWFDDSTAQQVEFFGWLYDPGYYDIPIHASMKYNRFEFNGTAWGTNIYGGEAWTSDGTSDDDPEFVVLRGILTSNAPEVTQVMGDTTIMHFVTPKNYLGAVQLYVHFLPDDYSDMATIESAVTWDGATPDISDPTQAAVSSATAAKTVVKAYWNTKTLQEARVWVVWATGSAANTSGAAESRYTIDDLHVPQQHNPGTAITASWNFKFQIEPTSMLTETNRPDFTGVKSVDPPAGTHLFSGDPLTGGANKKWDVSRRLRVKAFDVNVARAWFFRITGAGTNVGTLFDNLPTAAGGSVIEDFPADDAKGNDDRSTGDENNVPTWNAADGAYELTSVDVPNLPGVADAGGSPAAGANPADTIEFRVQFGEFVRLEIAGAWYRASDFVPWRLHIKLVQKDEVADNTDYDGDGLKNRHLWVDNGSVTDNTNNGW